MLIRWKLNHEKLIKSLLLTHRSPLPVLRRFTEEGLIAQNAVDILEEHGVLFAHRMLEVDAHVMVSIERLRAELRPLVTKVKYDTELKNIIKDIVDLFRSFMNATGNFASSGFPELQALRNRVGVYVKILQDDYGCKVRGQLAQIIP